MDAGSYQQLSAFSGDVTSILGTYASSADNPNTKRRFEFGAPAVRLDSLTAAGSWLVESDHQLVATATQDHGQPVTVLKASPYFATNCGRLCG